MDKIYDFEERLVQFAGEVIVFVETISKNFAGQYYDNQLIRSSGATALNYGEAQGTVTNKDFIHKMSLVVKELKESRSTLKILNYASLGEEKHKNLLLRECEELIAISSKMIINRRKKRTRIGFIR